MNGLHSSSYFQVLHSLFQSFCDGTKTTSYNWYNRHFYVPQFLQFPSKVQVLILLFAFFHFYSLVSGDRKVHNSACSLLFVDYHLVWSSGKDYMICCISKSQRTLCVSFWVVHIQFVHMVKFQVFSHFPIDHLAHPVVSSLILFLC